jgi:anti-sigma B factor antagonist
MLTTRSSTITVTPGRTPVVAVSGAFEMAATFTVEPALDLVLATRELGLVTLDLSEVTFIDSVGLGVVIRFAGELEARGVVLRIVPGPPEVQRVFEAVGMADALPFGRGSAA